MQRLTKYALLLKAVLKKTEDTEQQDTLKAMAKKVESFVSHVNSHLRQRQENERLKTIIARIDSYEPVVSFNWPKKLDTYYMVHTLCIRYSILRLTTYTTEY